MVYDPELFHLGLGVTLPEVEPDDEFGDGDLEFGDEDPDEYNDEEDDY